MAEASELRQTAAAETEEAAATTASGTGNNSRAFLNQHGSRMKEGEERRLSRRRLGNANNLKGLSRYQRHYPRRLSRVLHGISNCTSGADSEHSKSGQQQQQQQEAAIGPPVCCTALKLEHSHHTYHNRHHHHHRHHHRRSTPAAMINLSLTTTIPPSCLQQHQRKQQYRQLPAPQPRVAPKTPLRRGQRLLHYLMISDNGYCNNGHSAVAKSSQPIMQQLAACCASIVLMIIILANSVTVTEGVDCFKCSSRNGSNPACEDPFHNLNTTRIISPILPDPPPNVIYHTPCFSGKKGREGLFLASACIKLTGTFDTTGETLVVRHCALDSGTLTQDTELARMSHCGKFQFERDLLKGCVTACPEDACNSAPSRGGLVWKELPLALVLSLLSSYSALALLLQRPRSAPSAALARPTGPVVLTGSKERLLC